jgi:hypothetical protein
MLLLTDNNVAVVVSEAVIREREGCAKLADKIASDHLESDGEYFIARKIADAIRKQ